MYTWGSAVHSALGYVVSHNIKWVDTPKRVPELKSPSSTVAGRTFTQALSGEGKLIRWGNQFGIKPVEVDSGNVRFDEIASCHETGQTLLIEKVSETVYICDADSLVPLLHAGRLLHARDIAVAGPHHFFIVERATGELIEIPQAIWLSHASLKSLGRCTAVFAGSTVAAAVCAETGDVRIFGPALDKPKRIIVSRRKAGDPDSWRSGSTEFTLRYPTAMSLPFAPDSGAGYALVDEGETVVRFNIDSVGSVVTGTVIGPPGIKFVAVSQTRDHVTLVSVAGDLFEIPHTQIVDLSTATPKLSQVISVSSSVYHSAALVRIVNPPFRVGPNELPRLKMMCTQALMKSVTPENVVVPVLTQLLERAVVDVPDLLNACWDFYRLNSSLIRCVVAADVLRIFQTRSDVSRILDRDDRDTPFSEQVIEAHLVNVPESPPEEPIMGSVEGKSYRKKSSVYSTKVDNVMMSSTTSTAVSSRAASPAMTPVIAMQLLEGGDSLFQFDDFVPLNGVSEPLPKQKTALKKVFKWKKQSIRSPPEAPWLSPPSTSSCVEPQSPPLASVLAEELASAQKQAEVIGRKVGRIDSRWYVNRSVEESIADIMRREQEEREAQEAIRLVEEYERALAEHNRSMHRSRKISKPKV